MGKIKGDNNLVTWVRCAINLIRIKVYDMIRCFHVVDPMCHQTTFWHYIFPDSKRTCFGEHFDGDQSEPADHRLHF